jgi:acyl carrier protein
MDNTATIRDFIISNFLFGDGEAMVADHDSLMDAGIVDSTGIMEVLGFLEDTWGITVDDGDLTPENFDSVDRIAALVARSLKERSAAG